MLFICLSSYQNRFILPPRPARVADAADSPVMAPAAVPVVVVVEPRVMNGKGNPVVVPPLMKVEQTAGI